MKFYYILPLLLLLVFSCKDEESPIEEVIVSSRDHHIEVTESDDHINIHIEALTALTDNRTGTFPDLDFFIIAIDHNSNDTIDENVDIGYGLLNAREICPFYMVNNSGGITPCGEFDSDATFTSDFISTSFMDERHVIWDVAIPKKDLNESKTLSFVIKVFTSGVGYTTYPLDNENSNTGLISFDKVLTIEW